MKNTIFTSKNLILSAFLLSLLVVSVSFAQEATNGVVAGAGPAYEETPTPTPVVTPAVSPSPSSTVTVSPSPAPSAEEEVGFLAWLMNSLGFWWLLVLAIVVAIGVYLSRKNRNKSPVA